MDHLQFAGQAKQALQVFETLRLQRLTPDAITPWWWWEEGGANGGRAEQALQLFGAMQS